jgi:hypothetical protein
MSEPTSPITPERTAAGELMLRAFGPFADALGQELEKAPAFVVRNIARLASTLQRKRGSRTTDGQVSSRVLRQVIEEAGWTEDSIVTEYLAGVLAASSTPLEKDRGVVMIAVIRRLPALQLRAHYVLFRELVRVGPRTRAIDLDDRRTRESLTIEISALEFAQALGNAATVGDDHVRLVRHVMDGLLREDLIDDYGSPERGSFTDQDTVRFRPSSFGAELFLWASGSQVTDARQILDEGLELLPFEDIPSLPSSRHDELQYLVALVHGDIDRRDFTAALERLEQMAEIERARSSHGFYFYSSLLAALTGRVGDAVGLMQLAHERATQSATNQTLTVLAHFIEIYPGDSALLTHLAEILERGRRSSD